MKLSTYTVILYLLIVSVVGCDNVFGPSPKEVLRNYLNSSLKGEYVEAYRHISSEDQAVKSLTDYILEESETDSPLGKAFTSKISFKILNVTKTGGNASAETEITLPDMSVMLMDLMGATFKSALENKNQEEVEQSLAKKYESGEVPLETQKTTFQLIKEKDSWKVFLDWKTEKIKKEKQAKIQGLMNEADELKNEKRLHGALGKYEQVLALDSLMVEAKEGIEKTNNEIRMFEEKQAYIGNVELYDLKAKYYTTFLEDRVPGVEFKLKNLGDRTLKKVEVTVYFMDETGAIIFEEDYHPVLVTKYSFGDNNKPLKPNYIWQHEQGKFYKADSVPNEWKEGSVSAKITDIELGD